MGSGAAALRTSYGALWEHVTSLRTRAHEDRPVPMPVPAPAPAPAPALGGGPILDRSDRPYYYARTMVQLPVMQVGYDGRMYRRWGRETDWTHVYMGSSDDYEERPPTYEEALRMPRDPPPPYAP